MAIDVERLTNLRIEDSKRCYSEFDARLYALSIGFGNDPLHEAELDYVCPGRGFKLVPTMASIFANVISDLTIECKLERPELALHAEQKLEVFSPLPAQAELSITGSIPLIRDRGANRGAEIHMVAEARVKGELQPLYRATYITVARGDGGFGGQKPDRRAAPIASFDRGPDASWEYKSRRNQALLYSLNGDRNPIHIDPVIAKMAGFDVPILHGLCTYGMACHAVLATMCDYDAERIGSFSARFSAPVLPGDTLIVDMWRNDKLVAFQASVKERDVIVLKGGVCQMVE